MARESNTGLGVNSRYGPLSLPDGAKGELGSSTNGIFLLSADWSADLINNDSINNPTIIISNCLPLRAWVEVEEAMSLSAAGAALSFGVSGALGTDSADVSGTSTGVGFKTAALKGTFSTGITASVTLAIGMASGSINAGAGRFVVECMKV